MLRHALRTLWQGTLWGGRRTRVIDEELALDALVRREHLALAVTLEAQRSALAFVTERIDSLGRDICTRGGEPHSPQQQQSKGNCCVDSRAAPRTDRVRVERVRAAEVLLARGRRFCFDRVATPRRLRDRWSLGAAKGPWDAEDGAAAALAVDVIVQRASDLPDAAATLRAILAARLASIHEMGLSDRARRDAADATDVVAARALGEALVRLMGRADAALHKHHEMHEKKKRDFDIAQAKAQELLIEKQKAEKEGSKFSKEKQIQNDFESEFMQQPRTPNPISNAPITTGV